MTETLKVLDKQIELQEKKTETAKVKGKWDNLKWDKINKFAIISGSVLLGIAFIITLFLYARFN